MSNVKRSYYPNGSIASEATLIDGIPHGVTRHWHPNGVLAQEIPLDHGIIDGTVREWNENGELLGESKLTKGTGLLRSWHPNGRLSSELSMIDGKWTGRFRVLWDDGELVEDSYYLADKKVSRKRYLAACMEDPNLPKYEDEKIKKWPPRGKKLRRRKKETVAADAAKTIDDLASKLLNGPKVREARSWLTETQEPSRSLGEDTDQAESLKLVTKLYGLGAFSVHVVEIDGAPDEDQNSGRLIVELPLEAAKREKLLKLCGRLARRVGFDPDPDVGQRYVLLMLD